MNKEKYYVNVASNEISQIKYGNNASYIIFATDEEIRLLRGKMDNIYEADRGTYWRAHIPIMSYHHDQANDAYDTHMSEAYQMIYELGDQEAKTHIVSMNVLNEPDA